MSIFDPSDIDEGEEIDLDPNASGNDTETVGRQDGPTRRGDSYVPLSEAVARHLERATRAMDRSEMPPSMRSFIRAYFDRLGAS